LGDRELWLNGQLNIGVVLYEDPSEIGNTGGFAGTGGSMWGTAGTAAGGTGAIP
jgi:hypothetical protein